MCKKLAAILLLISIIGNQIHAQQALLTEPKVPVIIPKKEFYRHYTGYLGSMVLSADINVGADEIVGNYYNSLENKEYLLFGKLSTFGKFMFTEYNQNGAEIATIELITDDFSNLHGVRTVHRSGKQSLIKLKENYNNSIKVETFKYTVNYHLQQIDSFPSLEIELNYLHPTDQKNNKPIEKIQQVVSNHYFGGLAQENLSIEKRLRNLADTMIADYKEFEHDYTYVPDMFFAYNWQNIYSMNVLYNDNDLFSCSALSYSYTGGAHGMSAETFLNIDLLTAQELKLENILIAEKFSELTELMIKLLTKQNDLPDIESLKHSNFDIKAVKPSENFYFNHLGLIFYFAPYEIAPYAQGPIEILISKKDLKPFINPNSIIWKRFYN